MKVLVRAFSGMGRKPLVLLHFAEFDTYWQTGAAYGTVLIVSFRYVYLEARRYLKRSQPGSEQTGEMCGLHCSITFGAIVETKN